MVLLLRVWGGPWEFEDCSLACEGGVSGAPGCVMLSSHEAKCVLARCQMLAAHALTPASPAATPDAAGSHERGKPTAGHGGEQGGDSGREGRGKLGYGAVCIGRSVVELRGCGIRGAREAAIQVGGRAACLASRCRLLDNAFGRSPLPELPRTPNLRAREDLERKGEIKGVGCRAARSSSRAGPGAPPVADLAGRARLLPWLT
jgi:hypothetical protein